MICGLQLEEREKPMEKIEEEKTEREKRGKARQEAYYYT